MLSEILYLRAGYYLEYLQHLRPEIEKTSNLDLRWALDRLCSFSLRKIGFVSDETKTLQRNWKQVLSVYHNLLVRGVPTYPTFQVEKFLIDSVSKAVPIVESDDKQNIVFRDRLPSILKEAWLKVLGRAHVALDPTCRSLSIEMDSSEERAFFEVLSRKLGLSVLQLVECQRPFSTLIRSDEARSFYDQRVDFSLETKDSRIIFEVDGKQHEDPKQKALDQKRDQFLRKNRWDVNRVAAFEVRQKQIEDRIQNLVERFNQDSFIVAANRNFTQPLVTHEAGRAALQLVVTPIAVARIQYGIALALMNGYLDIQKPHLRLAVIEWDLPCALLALSDLIKSVNHICKLAGVQEALPEIGLEVFRESGMAFEDFGLPKPVTGLKATVLARGDLQRLRKERYDLIISVSTLQIGPRNLDHLIGSNTCIAVDSVHSPRGADPQIASAYPIAYKLDDQPTELEESLVFFLHWIFRKRGFREGQFEMLRRSLALKDLIGLLPTSGGKSLCYQLSALLQPGTTVVVDPIISLMIDQIDNLKRLQIDAAGQISSDQNKLEREKAEERLVQRNFILFFISPERLQIPTFRDRLKNLCQTTPVPYLTIDEAHCVSEWGHDFRPSYLKLADNARRTCSHLGYQPHIIALTGTAPSVVLSDIQRVVGLTDKALVTPESLDRPELEFEITKCDSQMKWPKLRERLLALPSRFDKTPEEFFSPQNAGIVFCPHVGSTYGIVEVAGRIREEFQNLIPEVGMYSGKPPKGYTDTEWKKTKTKTQKDFKDNKVGLIVATKAFGMGIDKSNIRFTIHYNMPTSLEAFYQEAGRAGRDRSSAFCTLIFSGEPSRWKRFFDPNVTIEELGKMSDPLHEDDIQRMLYFHETSWPGVEKEYNEIMNLVTSQINPRIANLKYDDTTMLQIPFESSTAENEAEDSRNKIERMLYRLSVLGLVADYGLDHNARMFEVEVAHRTDDYYRTVLLEYVTRYKPAEYRDRFEKRIQSSQQATMFEKCLRNLLEFIYEEIEKKRRRAILNMAEVASTSPDNQAFRKAILNYLEPSESTKKLDKISKEMIPSEWLEIASNIEDIISAQRLREGCRRALESSPDHPGLLLLSSYARLFTSDKTAMDEFERAVKSLAKSPLAVSVQENAVTKVLDLVASERPSVISALCYVALQEFPRIEVARIALLHSEISSDVGMLAMRVVLGNTLEKVRAVRKHVMGGDVD